eukprot:TRINITY_DN9136_c0_g1_i1.p1 TRINITY_DN9136_c0_g1~~TRINITY_DN9136_c0_g1_i1.p1  ORF type:complete len:230 (-),score=67.77 TRINITY_DN9136_c0_g1_i1:171-860(-)
MASGEPSSVQMNTAQPPAQGFQWVDYFKGLSIPEEKAQSYATSFESEDITKEIFAELTESDLEKLGINSLGHRKVIAKAKIEEAALAAQSVPYGGPGYQYPVGTVETAYGPYAQRDVKKQNPEKVHKAYLKMRQQEAVMQQRQYEENYKQWKKSKKLNKQYQRYGGQGNPQGFTATPPANPQAAYSYAMPVQQSQQQPQALSGSSGGYSGEFYQPQGAYTQQRGQRKQF